MVELQQTALFRKWWSGLKNDCARGVIFSRLDRLAFGHAGDVEPVGEGVSELRIHHGPGYRIYFCRRGSAIVILLCGGDKSTQQQDIKAAKKLAKEWKE